MKLMCRGRALRADLDERLGLNLVWQTAVFLLSMLLIFTRRPGAFLHPQFFAEDGWVWFQQAYNFRWLHSLAIPQAGYLQLLPRLFAGLALLFPLSGAPLIMNVAGAAVQALPVNALLARRSASWGTLSTRIALSAAYLGIADAAEIHVVATNAMWHLALLQVIVVLSCAPTSWWGRLSDLVLFGVGAVSGPFCLLLLPSALIYWLFRRQRWTLVLAGVLSVGAVIQGITLMHAARIPPTPLGRLPDLVRLLGGCIVADSVVGHRGPRLPLPLLAMGLLAGLAIFVIAWRCAPLAMRLATLFALLVTAASLHDPLVFGSVPRWQVLAQVPDIRYWFFPSLMLLWALVFCAMQGPFKPIRLLSYAILVFAMAGDLWSWRYRSWPNNHFAAYVRTFEKAAPGQHVTFPIYPDARTMELIKR